jgi:hypothetical protein
MKIISYTVFGEEHWYRKGLIRNIEIARTLFEDWTVRVYLSDKIDREFIDKVSKYKNVDLVVKKEKYPFEGLLWRMLPMQEGHEAVIVRDCDTRLFQRDKNLVDDWMSLNFKYHICRDNPGSWNVMLGGLYGGKKPNLVIEDAFHKWRESYIRRKKNLYLWDIGFLRKFVYPYIRNDLIVYSEHVKMDCEKFVKKIPGERGLYKGKVIQLGMYIEEDFDKNDENKSPEDLVEFGRSRNKQRLEYFEVDKKFNPLDYGMITYKPIYKYKNSLVNSLYLFLSIILDKNISPIYLGYILFNNRLLNKYFKINKILNHKLYEKFR